MRASARMKAGVVVQIRVPPADVMTCIDLAQAGGLYLDGMSLAMVVRAALSGLCEHARKRGAAPIRDGFEFDRMVKPFLAVPQGRKVAVTSHLDRYTNGQKETKDAIPNLIARKPVMMVGQTLTEEEMERYREINDLIVRSAIEEGKTIDQWGEENPDLYKEFKVLNTRV